MLRVEGKRFVKEEEQGKNGGSERGREGRRDSGVRRGRGTEGARQRRCVGRVGGRVCQ